MLGRTEAPRCSKGMYCSRSHHYFPGVPSGISDRNVASADYGRSSIGPKRDVSGNTEITFNDRAFSDGHPTTEITIDGVNIIAYS